MLRLYFLLGFLGVAVISFGAALLVPFNEFYRSIISFPGLAALFGAVWQMFRDRQAYERTMQLQSEQQLFNLGATSHMANTVFDKHVAFCEKYVAEVHELVVTLTRRGPTAEAVEHGNNLYRLRIEYAAWLTPNIDQKLEPFERAARIIGASAGLVETLRGEEDRQGTRSKAIAQMFDVFSNMLGFEDVVEKNEEATVLGVKNKVREILQVDQLVAIREHLVGRAFDALGADKKS